MKEADQLKNLMESLSNISEDREVDTVAGDLRKMGFLWDKFKISVNTAMQRMDTVPSDGDQDDFSMVYAELDELQSRFKDINDLLIDIGALNERITS